MTVTTEIEQHPNIGGTFFNVLVDGEIVCSGDVEGVHEAAVEEARALAEAVRSAVADFYAGRVAPESREVEANSPEATEEPEGPTVLLVACSAGKAREPRPALHLYNGSLYRLRVKWCRAVYGRDPDGILSAKHYLVEPDQVLEPYDVKLTGLDRDERRRWDRQTANALLNRWPRGTRFVVLAGAAYVEGWVSELRQRGRQVDRRSFGGICQERSALSKEITEARSQGQQLEMGAA